MPAPSRSARPRPARTRLAVRLLTLVLLALAALTGLVPAARMADATSTSPAATAIRYALAQLGKPYEWGGSGPTAYDCSGLTSQAYASAGIAIPRVSRDQYGFGTKIPVRSLLPGDLVYYGSDPDVQSSIYHVAMYLGNGRMIAAPHAGTVVQIESMWWSGLMPYGTRPAGTAPGLLEVEYGNVGDQTWVVQTRLRASGFGLAVDGGFGPITLGTVRDFQARYGLDADGVVGPLTWGALVTYGLQLSPSSSGAAGRVTGGGTGLPAAGTSEPTPGGVPARPLPPQRTDAELAATS